MRTKGLLVSVYNCGIVNGFREMFGSESMSQVTLFLLDMIKHTNNDLPEYIIYNLACHLKKFTENRNFANKIQPRAQKSFS